MTLGMLSVTMLYCLEILTPQASCTKSFCSAKSLCHPGLVWRYSANQGCCQRHGSVMRFCLHCLAALGLYQWLLHRMCLLTLYWGCCMRLSHRVCLLYEQSKQTSTAHLPRYAVPPALSATMFANRPGLHVTSRETEHGHQPLFCSTCFPQIMMLRVEACKA